MFRANEVINYLDIGSSTLRELINYCESNLSSGTKKNRSREFTIRDIIVLKFGRYNKDFFVDEILINEELENLSIPATQLNDEYSRLAFKCHMVETICNREIGSLRDEIKNFKD